MDKGNTLRSQGRNGIGVCAFNLGKLGFILLSRNKLFGVQWIAERILYFMVLLSLLLGGSLLLSWNVRAYGE